MPALQQLVDRLSITLDQPVLVDDAAFRPLAYSAHGERDLDAVRTASIVGRHARPEVIDRLRSAGVAEADRPMRIPGDHDLGLSPRWCAPIRGGGRLLGFVWVIADGELADSERDRLLAFAGGVATVIEQDHDGAERKARRQALRDLLTDEPIGAYDAAAHLVAAGALDANDRVVVVAAQCADGRPLDEVSRVLANVGVRSFLGARTQRAALGGFWGDRAICLISHREGDALERRAQAAAAELREALGRALGDDVAIAVGIGSVSDALTGARASYDQACWAANVAAKMPEYGPVASWCDLGVFQLLSAVRGGRDALPGGLMALFDSPNSDMLIQTLEVYLDEGGDAQATASRLYLARGSLYYRLHRIEELAGVNLRSGGDRLLLHLGLKIARLVGLYDGSSVAQAPLGEAA